MKVIGGEVEPNHRHHWVAYNWMVASKLYQTKKLKGHVEFWLNLEKPQIRQWFRKITEENVSCHCMWKTPAKQIISL